RYSFRRLCTIQNCVRSITVVQRLRPLEPPSTRIDPRVDPKSGLDRRSPSIGEESQELCVDRTSGRTLNNRRVEPCKQIRMEPVGGYEGRLAFNDHKEMDLAEDRRDRASE